MTRSVVSNILSLARTGLKGLTLIGFYCMFEALTATNVWASNATWSANPATGDWNTAGNWVQGVVPDGTATFGVSNTTNVSVSLALTDVGKIIFSPGASGYSLSTLPDADLLFQPSGIVNNSGIEQNFSTSNSVRGGIGFIGAASAGVQTKFTIAGGALTFSLSAVADEATINTLGAPTADGVGGFTGFYDNSSASAATISNEAGQAEGANGGLTVFQGTSRAGTAVVTCEGGSVSGANGGPASVQRQRQCGYRHARGQRRD